MLSGTVEKSVPNEKPAENVGDEKTGSGLASFDVMYVTTKNSMNKKNFEILFLREVKGNFNEVHGFASVP